jgi:putative ABC transport system substrate-binding protein
MERRKFISLLGGAAAWPVTSWAQKAEGLRRVGVLMAYAEDNPLSQRMVAALRQGLTEAGWTLGHDLQIDVRWSNGDVERIKKFASEIVALKPNVILSNSTPVTAVLKRETSTIPIVFNIVSDPVGAGFIASLSRPSGNLTGFINVEEAMGGKWLELLKEAAPSMRHAAIVFNPEVAPGGGSYFLPSFDAAGLKLGVRTTSARVHNPADIERAITDLASEPGGGLVVNADSFNAVHRKELMELAAAHKLPAIFPGGSYATEGGLLGYGPDNVDLFARSASYVDRVLRGENPGNLPVQVPRKFDLVINLKTAKDLGLAIPLTLQAAANEVVE